MHDPDQGFPLRNLEKKTALSVRSDSSRKPSLVNPEADYQIPQRVWSNWTPASGRRELKRELTVTERRIEAHRATELTMGLHPFTHDERKGIDFALSRMLGGFQRHLDVAPIVDVLLDLLREFPAWAILDGCTKIASDQHGLNPPFNPNFGPSDNQIFQVIAGVVAPYRLKLKQAQDLLSAPVERPAQETKPLQTWEEVKAEMVKRGMNFPGEKRHHESPGAVMAKYGLSQEAWDAIPDYDQKKHTSDGRNE